ncbi:MAG: SDR family NAD(P)-dependent oxidoreductase [Oscillospiraceae bacterium]|nr:SDR family NAD(P)-dependent oxidoreductase [Oscillospiraceae bacterium]
MDLHLRDKVVVVTGGATGIGKAAAAEFAREGARVIICGRRMEKLREACAQLQSEGLDLEAYQLDVCDKAAMQAMADAIVEKYECIDVWVNNAGIAISKPVMDFTDEDYEKIMQTNLKSVFEGCRIAGAQMQKQQGGVIINASSFATKIPQTNGTLYAASKAAVNSMTRTFSANFAPFGIRVVGYIPGMIITDIATDDIKKNENLYVANVAAHRLGVPADLAKPIVFLASDACGYVTGCEFEASGGKYVVQNASEPWDAV